MLQALALSSHDSQRKVMVCFREIPQHVPIDISRWSSFPQSSNIIHLHNSVQGLSRDWESVSLVPCRGTYGDSTKLFVCKVCFTNIQWPDWSGRKARILETTHLKDWQPNATPQLPQSLWCPKARLVEKTPTTNSHYRCPHRVGSWPESEI